MTVFTEKFLQNQQNKRQEKKDAKEMAREIVDMMKHPGFAYFWKFITELNRVYRERLLQDSVPRKDESFDHFVGFNRGGFDYGRSIARWFKKWRKVAQREEDVDNKEDEEEKELTNDEIIDELEEIGEKAHAKKQEGESTPVQKEEE